MASGGVASEAVFPSDQRIGGEGSECGRGAVMVPQVTSDYTTDDHHGSCEQELDKGTSSGHKGTSWFIGLDPTEKSGSVANGNSRVETIPADQLSEYNKFFPELNQVHNVHVYTCTYLFPVNIVLMLYVHVHVDILTCTCTDM